MKRGNYHGLKLTEQVMKVLIDVIFVVRQLQEKYLAANKRLHYMAFIDLEKAFDRVPWKVILVGTEKTW